MPGQQRLRQRAHIFHALRFAAQAIEIAKLFLVLLLRRQVDAHAREHAQPRARHALTNLRKQVQQHIQPAIGRAGVRQDRRTTFGGEDRFTAFEQVPKRGRNGVANHDRAIGWQPIRAQKARALPIAAHHKAVKDVPPRRDAQPRHRLLINIMTGPQDQLRPGADGFADLSPRPGRQEQHRGVEFQFRHVSGREAAGREARHPTHIAGLGGRADEEDVMAQFRQRDRQITRRRLRPSERPAKRRLHIDVPTAGVDERDPHRIQG